MSGPANASARRVFLTAEWRQLVMLSYDVDPVLLRELTPTGTTLDLWRERALVSVIGFRFASVRVLGVRVPFHTDFDEVNLRFYVRRVLESGELRRGVVFVRELVPRAAIALVARLAYHEPYRALPMRSSVRDDPDGEHPRIEYEWRTRSNWEHVAATADGAATLPAAGSEAEFVTEHYWGYTRRRDGRTLEYEVVHPQWRVRAAKDAELVADVASLYGSAFESSLRGAPSSAFIADGSPVVVYKPTESSAR